ncbi:MAG TPA: hypothetical protein PK228_06160, partial [Saprospiraceae bacterium]|nr:hypothetical protein [Saprospiraceae bacterium]
MPSPSKLLLAVALLLTASFSFAQPVNDDCAGATLLSVGANTNCDNTVAGTTVLAGYSGVDYCGMPYRDVWYKFVATASAHTLSISNANDTIANSSVYFLVEVFSGDCSSLSHSFCSEWYYWNGNVSFGDLTPGDTYFIRVLNPNSQAFNFDICLSTPPAPPANDACAGAITIDVDPDAGCDAPLSGNTTGATASPVPVCNECVFADDDVWYKFTATQANHIVALNNIRFAGSPGDVAFGIAYIFSGNCGNLAPVRGFGFYGDGSDVVTNLTPGETYYIRVYSSYVDIPVTFDLCVSSPPPPANDECAGAEIALAGTDLYCGTPFYGSTYLATSSGTDCSGGTTNDVWFQFVATSQSQRIELYPATGIDQFGFEVYEGACGSQNSLACASGNNTYVILTGLTVGATYYLRIFSPPNNTYYFTGCILALPPAPANDECAAAAPLSVSPDTGCNAQTIGSTLSATSSAQNCAGNTATHDVWYSFVATGNIHRLEVNPNITIFGGVLQFGYEVFSGDCNNLTSVVCKSFPNDYGPSVLDGLTPGATYYVRAYSEYGSAHEFSICVQTIPPPPANTSCADAQEIIPAAGIDCDGVTAGTTAGLSTVDPGYCYYGMDVWYQFTATTNTHIVRISDVQHLYGNYGNYYVEIYGGTDCDNLSLLQCQSYASNFYVENLTPGQTYYIRWASESFSAHQFNICIGSVPPPANDLCANTILLPVDNDLVCDNTTPGTTAGSSHVPVQDACFNNNDVWYSFTATQAAHQIHLSEVVDLVNGYGNYFLAELFTGDCNSLSSVYCWSAFNYYDATVVAGDLTPGQTYHIRIANPYDVAINFNICVLTPPPPPVNDACANAVPLNVEPGADCTAATAGTTLNATPSPGLELVCCGGGDVWYSFVATQANQNVWLSNIVDVNNGYQGYAFVQVYTSACDTYTLLANEIAFGGNPLYITQLTPGETYHIRVYPFYNSQAVNFDICVASPPPPVNDECAGALPLPVSESLDCNISLNASTAGATQSQPACNGIASNDIWYQFTATSATYRFDMNVNNGSYNEWGYELFAGDCNNLTSLQCYEPPYSTTFNLEGLTVGATYYLRLFSAQNRIHNLFVCTRPLPPPPANDECAAAIAVTVDSDLSCDAPTQGTTLSATQSQSSCYGYPSNDVWYTFTATGVSHLLELIPTTGYFNGSSYDLGFEVTGGDCDNPIDILCQDYLYQNGFVLQNLTPGASYFVRVYSKYEYAHDFTLCVMTLPPPPANDQCEQATPVLPNEDLTCNNIYPGTTLGATPSLFSNVPDVWYSFTATSNSHIFELLNINAILGYPGNIGLEVYQGSDCNALIFLANFQPGNFPGIINYLQPGETYRVRVYPLDPNAAYTFDLCIKTLPPSPPNETCAGAFELTPNTDTECDIVTEGTTAGAVTLDYYTCAYGNDVWYKFIATSPNHQIQATNITTVLGYGNLSVAVMQSTDCINFNTIACVYGDQTIYLSGLITGETYYVRVASDYYSAHTYTLCIKTIPPPPNDLCENATPLSIDEDQFCDNAVSGTAAGAGPSGFSACSYDANDVWYSFTATQTAHTIYFSNVVDAQFGYAGNFGVEIYTGTCSNLQNVSCRQNLYLNDFYTLGELTPGQAYFIRFMTYNSNGANFNVCVGTPPPPPANDACVNAANLPVSSGETCETLIQGSTENATPTPGFPYYGYGTQNNDVWFAFTATQANHGIEFSNIYNPGSFLIAEVYSGECGTLNMISQLFLPYYGTQLLLTNLTPGAAYYVRVYEYYNQATTFDICVTSLPVPSNDECAGAITLPVDPDLQCESPTAGSTYGATQSFSNCYGGATNDVWFQFTATGVSHRLDINSITGGSNYFSVEIYEGDCEALTTFLSCSQNYYAYAQTIQGLTPGNTYYVRVSSDPGFFLNFYMCVRTLPPPPANDECAGATVIEPNTDYYCDLAYNGTTLGATQSATSCYGGATHDVWYQFTATGVTHVFDLVFTGDPLGNNSSMGMEIYAGGDCQNLVSPRCTESHYTDPVTLTNLEVGATYFVRVFSQYNSAFDFSLCIRTLPPPPANDACANAVVVQPNPGMECIETVAGSTAGLLEYNYYGCTSG